MLIGPRITEYVYGLLATDGILSDPTVLPGGVHRDVLPEDQRDYPAMVVSYVSGADSAFLQTTNTAGSTVFFQIEAKIKGTDIDPLRVPTDRADVLVRRIGRTPDVSPDGRPVTIEIGDGVRLANVRRAAETNRTTAEVGEYYAHLGAQYACAAAEPDLAGQSGQ